MLSISMCSNFARMCLLQEPSGSYQIKIENIIARPSPSAACVRAYMAVVGGEPSIPQPLPSEGKEDVHSPTSYPQPSRETQQHLTTDLGDLVDDKLHQLMEDLCQEVILCELNVPPKSPPPVPWRDPASNGGLDEDDQEVTFQEREGVPPCQPFWPPAPPQSDGGWASQGPPPQPLTPAQPSAGVGHLINTLMSGLHLGTLRIYTFSMEVTPGKTEVSFEQWYHEGQCIKNHYPESVVWEGIVRSLKGAAADMARYMVPTAGVFWHFTKIDGYLWGGCIIQCIDVKFL